MPPGVWYLQHLALQHFVGLLRRNTLGHFQDLAHSGMFSACASRSTFFVSSGHSLFGVRAPGSVSLRQALGDAQLAAQRRMGADF